MFPAPRLRAGFEVEELSPVCPLGTVSTLAPISQDSLVVATRGYEVVADSTAVLALECAVRRLRPPGARVHLV